MRVRRSIGILMRATKKDSCRGIAADSRISCQKKTAINFLTAVNFKKYYLLMIRTYRSHPAQHFELNQSLL